MIGLIIELLVSWLLLRLTVKKNLSVLGFTPSRDRISQWLISLLLAAGCCILYQVMATSSAGNGWMMNTRWTWASLLPGLWWVVSSVLFEELIFRGALLYIAIEKTGIKKACFLSAAAFGIYHWFSYNIFNNPVQMAIVFVITAIFGYMLAYAFAVTKSLYLPVGLHLGWNFFNIIVFSNGPLGNQILIKANENKPEGILSLVIFLFQILGLPLLVFWYLRYLKLKDDAHHKKSAE
ncbi:MAG: CPBP family intramembrane metalloprotease [Chryseobacterium sp.]|jgi:membrane protease YdiL (CAAX protease family)|uniref:CPBP family intramembrane glutamic endopeptidase n=1 Tax=Chryseobacterium sp. TaxID=1871047 RepID=UPI002819C4AB|nr:CPBP family intramembrane glutamic endopeptidase [Chryseobacterium sp.]MDR2237208.1 CPBP family intramembrane metalloprotease [Chryseobacterium sp.]